MFSASSFLNILATNLIRVFLRVNEIEFVQGRSKFFVEVLFSALFIGILSKMLTPFLAHYTSLVIEVCLSLAMTLEINGTF